jgi:hypothetical protein
MKELHVRNLLLLSPGQFLSAIVNKGKGKFVPVIFNAASRREGVLRSGGTALLIL